MDLSDNKDKDRMLVPWEAQTRITASGNCFYLLEALETAEEEAIKAQLEEILFFVDAKQTLVQIRYTIGKSLQSQ